MIEVIAATGLCEVKTSIHTLQIREFAMDKVGKDTGAGKVAESVVRKLTGGQVNILLFNYNFDGNLLKPTHTDYLDKILIPFLKERKYHVKMRGMTSRQGDREYNQQLSLERVLRVKKYLTSRGIPESKVPGPDVSAVGEDYSTSQHDDDELDRGVLLTLAPGIKPFPIRIPKVTIGEIVYTPDPKNPGNTSSNTGEPAFGSFNALSTRWRIQFLRDMSVDDAMSSGAMIFRLHNLDNNLETGCIFVGGGAGVGTPMSVTLQGTEWSEFNTSKPVGFDDFEGPASYMTVLSTPHYLAGVFGETYKMLTGNSPGWSFLNFEHPSIPVVKLKTGGTIGVTLGSAQGGGTICNKPEPYREVQPGELETRLNELLQ